MGETAIRIVSPSGHRVLIALLLDVALVIAASLAAVATRDNLTLSLEKVTALSPYLLITALLTVIVFSSVGIARSIWRLSNRSDFVRILYSVALVVVGACLVTFSYDRLEHVSRSLPILQGIFAAGLLILSRIGFRSWHTRRKASRQKPRPFIETETVPHINVLIVGATPLAETFVRAVEEFAPERVRIVGILGLRERQVGRQLAGQPILGRPETVRDVLAELQTHGIIVGRIVIACRMSALSDAEKHALFTLEHESDIEIQNLSDQFGLTFPAARPRSAAPPVRFAIDPERVAVNQGRFYWRLKRAIDVVGALCLLVVLSPLVLAAAVAVGCSLGFPILFWQQRPGLGGRPFRLYKLRTMRSSHDAQGRPLSDAERTSAIGEFIRRTRVDEIPQLISVLKGDMSFIGPRPLLPRDQSTADRARLLIRPGLTGWAQVMGGRTISADDKAALDVWYVQHANLMLDLRILLSTIPIVLFGERVSQEDIAQAWDDLKTGGILQETPRPPTARKAA